MTKKLFFLCVLFLAISSSSFSQTYKNEFGFRSDNDAYFFLMQDRYYTNGLFIYFRRAVDQQQLKGSLEKLTYEIAAGQKIYNPISGYSPNPAQQDRPFAGHLYGGVSTSLFFKNESLLKLDLNLGMLGPASLAEDGQKLLHDVVGFYEVKGWEYQIANDFSANATVAFAKLLHRSANNAVDFTLDTYANLGTTHNGAGVGVVFRAGNLNQLFSSSYYNALIEHNSKSKKTHQKEFYFYTKPQLNLVVYDATVSGSLFNDDSPVTFQTKPFVFAQQLGVNYSSPRFTLDYSFIFKSREIKSAAKPHQYSSIAMYYRFN